MKALKDAAWVGAVFLIPIIGWIIYSAHKLVPTKYCGIDECIGDEQGFWTVWGATAIGTVLIALLVQLLRKVD